MNQDNSRIQRLSQYKKMARGKRFQKRKNVKRFSVSDINPPFPPWSIKGGERKVGPVADQPHRPH
jgi:hypothetical protein